MVADGIKKSDFVRAHESSRLHATDPDDDNRFLLHIVNTIEDEPYDQIDSDASDKLRNLDDEQNVGVCVIRNTLPSHLEGQNCADEFASWSMHDLMIRVRFDRFIGVPEEIGYRSLQRTLPLMVEAINSCGVKNATQTGGGHFSIGWAHEGGRPHLQAGRETNGSRRRRCRCP